MYKNTQKIMDALCAIAKNECTYFYRCVMLFLVHLDYILVQFLMLVQAVFRVTPK